MAISNNKVVIGFCGYSGVGKDTAYIEIAKLAPSMLFQRVAFADKVKEDLKACEEALTTLGHTPAKHPDFKEKMRPVWVAWATAAREFDPMFWISRVERDIREWGRRSVKVCLTDVRFANEIDFLQRMLKGYVIYIERPGVGPKNAKETESFKKLLLIYPDLLKNKIVNDGTPEELGAKVLARLEEVYDFKIPAAFECPVCHENLHQNTVTCCKCAREVCKSCTTYNAPKKVFFCSECKKK